MKRRKLLEGLSGSGMVAISGCLASFPTLETVTPVEKRITGYRKEDGTLPTENVTILERRYWTEESGPEYRQDSNSPLDLPADDEPFFLEDDTYESLENQFDELIIHMHVCTDGLHESGEWGCTGPKISRGDFNKFTLEDELLIRFHAGVGASVYRVYEGEGNRNE